MPELPEVETIRRDLEKTVLGHRVVAVDAPVPQAVAHPTPERFVQGLTGRMLLDAERIGKYLMLRLDDGRWWTVHLSLEGRFLLDPKKPAEDLLVARLDDGRQLVLRDNVSFAKTYLLSPEDLGSVLHLPSFGPEPISPGFSTALLRERMAGRRGMIKPLLLDQHRLAGVGNIYADEALFLAKLHPTRKINTLDDAQWEALHDALVQVLNEGIADRGTSAAGGLYRDLYGRKGHHQEHLRVFRRAGKPCPRCGAEIAKTVVGSRPTFFCPRCQA